MHGGKSDGAYGAVRGAIGNSLQLGCERTVANGLVLAGASSKKAASSPESRQVWYASLISIVTTIDSSG